MADRAGIATRHWAILIGIDYYVGDRCLQGSVRDVETVKQYLEAGPIPVDIAILTAITPSDPSSHRLTEELVLWPTYDNITTQLKRVLEKAKRGDFVYIHYSGHGTRRKDERSTHPAGNLAFVLFEDNEHGSRYLMGKVLASCLRKMVEQGLLVTLVLDCCHSGSVLYAGRAQDADIRAIDYNPAVDAASPPDLGPFGSDSTLRDAQIPPGQWLINPDGYTILAACGLYERNFSFFGKLNIAPGTAFTPVYRAEDGCLCLSVGEAHGVHKGDEYVVYPFDTPEGVASHLVGVEVGSSVVKQIEAGWKAKPVTHLSPRKTSVRLTASASSQLQWTEAVKKQPFLHLCTEDEDTKPCIFNVTLNEHKEYEILDGSLERIISLPAISLDTPRASDRVMDVLQHLATFKFFEGVENRTPNASFEGSFSLLPTDSAGASGVFDIRHGNEWGFMVENFGDRPLYLAIFNFKPSWQITNLVSEAGGGDCIIVQPKGEDGTSKEEIRLKMHVPEPLRSRGEKRCEDIVKVFITSKQTSFPSMVLPKLSEAPNRVARGGDDQLLKFLLELTTPFRDQDHTQEEWASWNFIICTAME
ncbi:hypothetical protein MFIFM68171_07334 [Madurella fahalii]|uniref:Peptidase C14 caspase domain-containing protein n=1 Tax=Madurella fahalii TaxID=1157608 RepID=A0ABQ0GH89_9PEZI